MDYELLFSPINIGSMTVKNRIVMSAAEFSLGEPSGKPTERLMDYYEERAKGGVGMITPGICRVNDMAGAATFTQLSMSRDANIEPMREFASRIHRHGAKLCIQLHHAGRQGLASSINSLPLVIPLVKCFPKSLNTIYKSAPKLLALEQKKICFSVQAPSDCALQPHGAARLHAMSRREIRKLIGDFIRAAERCKKAGVDAVELHAGHGYLLQQFLSPVTNLRTDEYGGSFENRLRFLSEIVTGIKERCGRDYPLIVRLTVDEMYARIGRPELGYDLETGKKIAQHLEALGVDAINVTSAGYDVYNCWLEPTSFEPGWRKYLAKEIKKTVSVPVIAAGVIRTPEQAEQQLRDGCQDLIASARTFICDPHWAEKAAEGHPEQIRRCIGCLNCIRSFMDNAARGIPGECALNMTVGKERQSFPMEKDGAGRPVIVLGAGPAGLKAAETLVLRGFSVQLYEKNAKPGGQVLAAAAGNCKERLIWAIEDLTEACRLAGAELHFGETLSAEEIAAAKPYAVIVATGGIPVRPRSIPGIDGAQVFAAPDVILGNAVIEGSDVVVVGSGLTGLEVTETLNDHGNRVTVVEMAPEIAPGAWFQLVDDELERIRPFGTQLLTAVKLAAIEPGKVKLEDAKTGEATEKKADYVVLAMGTRPAPNEAERLRELGLARVYTVGDAVRSGTIANACHSAYDTVMGIR